jgi:hypothetical protein
LGIHPIQIETIVTPGTTPGIARHELLQWGRKGIDSGKYLVDKGFAHHLLTHPQTLLKLFVAIHSYLEKPAIRATCRD